ncbi:MAG: efflux RND transporter periplasmic adaptor subunit [Minisyncoccia bacterium]
MSPRLLAIAQVLAKPAVAIGGSVTIAVVLVGGAWLLSRTSSSGNYTAAVNAPITETVSASGPVQSAQATDLSFQVPGKIAAINVTVGEHVAAGQTLLTLDGGSQAATVASAKANLESAQANLDSLQAGTRPEQLAIDQSAVAQDQDALRNAVRSAYIAADTAVHTDADALFSNPRTPSPQLNLIVPDSVLVSRLEQERAAIEPMLTSWGTQVSATTFASTDPSVIGQTSSANLATLSAFFDDLAEALAETPASASLSASALASYQASIAAARSALSGSASALTSATALLTAAEGTLALAQAGATPDAIAGASAQVDAAQAALEAAEVASGQTVLSAPIAGVVTVQNADPGQTVSPGVVLVSLESDASWQAKAPVSQVDIAKVKVGQAVEASFDAYPGVSFPATVSAVDPAATVTNGVASYEVTATFVEKDPRIYAGLTAHLSIITDEVESALVVPTSAVITDSSGGQFVYVKGTSGPGVKTPVETGIESASGTVQILSGLSAGQQVLTFGAAG